ncbi:PREDICTED: 50S ribosomal protein HLP, mitochondrial-like [Prunus mume]|uniref:50S ribosomal protein HLP, mitochondrial-like n=1 Tax=Prunus mume TaxID=102107 RepID=A0ABM1LTF2_PRUMU|nr:PREDICTED: 50S ribosomal protein HLP, mitochondrial-like [Prunus mume]
MAAGLAKCSRGVGRSLMGGLGNNLSGLLRTSHDMTCSPFLSQQQRTFIQMGTILQVADNSGAKKVRCIQALKASKKGARLGDTIVASVTEAHHFNAKIERKHQKEEKKKITGKGAVVYAVVVRAAMQRGRCDGSEVKFDDNAVVLVDKNNRQPLGTRVFGPVPHELRKKKHLKILSLAQDVA